MLVPAGVAAFLERLDDLNWVLELVGCETRTEKGLESCLGQAGLEHGRRVLFAGICVSNLRTDGREGQVNSPLLFPQLKRVLVLVQVQWRWRTVRLEGSHLALFNYCHLAVKFAITSCNSLRMSEKTRNCTSRECAGHETTQENNKGITLLQFERVLSNLWAPREKRQLCVGLGPGGTLVSGCKNS